MPRKKVEATEVKAEDVTELSFYQCQELIHEIQMLAAENEGELTDEQISALIEAQTQTPVKLHSLCNFLKMVEAKIQICKDRKAEINESQKKAEGILERMEGYLGNWVESQGKTYHVDEYTLTTRKSKSVELIDGFDDPFFCAIEMKRVVKPDKKKIKEALEAGEEVGGATLIEKVNLTIK